MPQNVKASCWRAGQGLEQKQESVEGNFVYSFWMECSESQTVILRSSKGPARCARNLTLLHLEVFHFTYFIHLGSENKRKRRKTW